MSEAAHSTNHENKLRTRLRTLFWLNEQSLNQSEWVFLNHMDKITNPLLPIDQKTVLITKYHTSKFVKQVKVPKSLIEFTLTFIKNTLLKRTKNCFHWMYQQTGLTCCHMLLIDIFHNLTYFWPFKISTTW